MRIEQPKNFTATDNDTPFFTSGSNTTSFEGAVRKAATRTAVEATGDKAAIDALDDPNLADSSNTGPALSEIESVEKVSDNVVKLKTRDGKEVIIVKQVTPYL